MLQGQAAVPLTREIPSQCRAIVEAIRKEVPRPDSLPTPCLPSDGLRLRFGGCAPMGFLPDAVNCVPWFEEDFEGDRFELAAIRSLAVWWDEQVDAAAAVDAIWGPIEKRRGVDAASDAGA